MTIIKTPEQSIALEILENNNIKTLIETDELARYNGGVFHKGNKAHSEIRTQITDIATDFKVVIGETEKPYNCSTSKRNEILELIKSQSFIELNEFDKQENRINVLNGHLHHDKGKWTFLKHFKYNESPYLSFTQIPVDYNPDAECLKIDQFLEDVFGFERVPDIYEMLGYFLMPTIKYQKAFILYGPPKTGKTSFINLVKRFVGGNKPHELIAGVSLQMLEKRFQLSNLRNKILNIYDDLQSTKMTQQGKFRMSVTNPTLTAEVKYVTYHLTWKNRIKNLFSCNILPSVEKNTGEEFWRRWKLYDCFNEFNGTGRKLDFVNMKWSNEELSGLLNKCLDGWLRLEERGHFENDDTEYIKGIWQIDAEPAKLFVDAECEIGSENVVNVDVFWRALNRYRKQFNGKPISKTMCTQSLQRISDLISKPKRKQGNVYEYEGIKLNDDLAEAMDDIYEPEIKNQDLFEFTNNSLDMDAILVGKDEGEVRKLEEQIREIYGDDDIDEEEF